MKGWKTLSGEEVPDIGAWVLETSKDGQAVHIGCDSLQQGKYTVFIVVVVIHTPGKGGRVAFQKDIVPRIQVLRLRLLQEVYKSLEVAMSLPEGSPLSIHIDANPLEQHMSSKYIQELTGLVMGSGFKAVIKPEAWAATHCADFVVRS